MNLALAFLLLAALVGAWYVARRMSRRRGLNRQNTRRARNERTAPRSFAPAKTKRSEMRTDDDPTTIIERITESKPPVDNARDKNN